MLSSWTRCVHGEMRRRAVVVVWLQVRCFVLQVEEGLISARERMLGVTCCAPWHLLPTPLLEEKHRASTNTARSLTLMAVLQTILEQPQTPKPRSPPPVTISQDFKLRSEERVKLHKEVLDPAKRSKMTQAEREKLVRTV